MSEVDPVPLEMHTRRGYLTIVAMMAGADWTLAREAVATTAIEHPEWDMDELKTFDQWASGSTL